METKQQYLLLKLVVLIIGTLFVSTSWALDSVPYQSKNVSLFSHINYMLSGSYAMGNLHSGVGGKGLVGFEIGNHGYYAGLSYQDNTYSVSTIYRYAPYSRFIDTRFSASYDMANVLGYSLSQMTLGTELHLSSWFVGGNGYIPLKRSHINGEVNYTGKNIKTASDGRLVGDGYQNYLTSYMNGDTYVGTYLIGMQVLAGPVFTKTSVGYQFSASYPLTYQWGGMNIESQYLSDSYVGNQYSVGIRFGISNLFTKGDKFGLYSPVHRLVGIQVYDETRNGTYDLKDQDNNPIYYEDLGNGNTSGDGSGDGPGSGKKDYSSIFDKIAQDREDGKGKYFRVNTNLGNGDEEVHIGNWVHVCGGNQCNVKLSDGSIVNLFSSNSNNQVPDVSTYKTLNVDHVIFNGNGELQNITINSSHGDGKNVITNKVYSNSSHTILLHKIYLKNVYVPHGYVKFETNPYEGLEINVDNVLLNPILRDNQGFKTIPYREGNGDTKYLPEGALTLVSMAEGSEYTGIALNETGAGLRFEEHADHSFNDTFKHFKYHFATFVGNVHGKEFYITYGNAQNLADTNMYDYQSAAVIFYGKNKDQPVHFNNLKLDFSKQDNLYSYLTGIYYQNIFDYIDFNYVDANKATIIAPSAYDESVTGEIHLNHVTGDIWDLKSGILYVNDSKLGNLSWQDMGGYYEDLVNQGLTSGLAKLSTKNIVTIKNSFIANLTLKNSEYISEQFEGDEYANIVLKDSRFDTVTVKGIAILHLNNVKGLTNNAVDLNWNIEDYTLNLGKNGLYTDCYQECYQDTGYLDIKNTHLGSITVKGNLGYVHIEDTQVDGAFVLTKNVGTHYDDNGIFHDGGLWLSVGGSDNSWGGWMEGDKNTFDVRNSTFNKGIDVNGTIRGDDPYFKDSHILGEGFYVGNGILGKITLINSEFTNFIVDGGLPYYAEIYINHSTIGTFKINGDINGDYDHVNGFDVNEGNFITIENNSTIGEFVMDGNIQIALSDRVRSLKGVTYPVIIKDSTIGKLSFKKNINFLIRAHDTDGILVDNSTITTFTIGSKNNPSTYSVLKHAITLRNNSVVDYLNIYSNIMGKEGQEDMHNINIPEKESVALYMRDSIIKNLNIGQKDKVQDAMQKMENFDHIIDAKNSTFYSVNIASKMASFKSAIKMDHITLINPMEIYFPTGGRYLFQKEYYKTLNDLNYNFSAFAFELSNITDVSNNPNGVVTINNVDDAKYLQHGYKGLIKNSDKNLINIH